MHDAEMEAWVALCDTTEANETTAFDAVAIIVETGMPRDAAMKLAERWSTVGDHRIRPAADGLWTWDFGLDGKGPRPAVERWHGTASQGGPSCRDWACRRS
ncbi:hypothetical protein [Burkholderia multivorans]|nr:hypothetical protein [Burkholderia multivorans]PRE52160.1 hypothetical protein C6P97_07665 [Burkholderia multivorans]